MKERSVHALPLELSYTIPKPFFTNPEQAYAELPPYFETDPRNGTFSRSVPVHVEAYLTSCRGQGQPFEEVEFTLYGAIRSQVQHKVAVKKILHSTELRKWSDFQKHQRGKNSEGSSAAIRYFCDLVFPIDQSSDSRHPSKKARLLPSIDIRASKYVTQSTALNDQHLVSGRCEIIYCVEARFLFSDGRHQYTSMTHTGDVSAQLARNSVVSLQPSPSMIRLIPPCKLLKGEAGSFEVQAEAKGSNVLRMKKQCQSLLSVASHQTTTQPKVLFSIQQSLAQNHLVTTSAASTSTFVIPVTLTVTIPSTAASTNTDPGVDTLRQCLTKSGFPNLVTVASTWHTKYTFTNSPDSPSEPDNTMESSTVRRDSRVLKFPPFYEISKSQYTATADLEVSVLAGLPTTSNDGLLKVQHFLSLALDIGEEEEPVSQTTLNPKSISLKGMTTKNIRVECLVDV